MLLSYPKPGETLADVMTRAFDRLDREREELMRCHRLAQALPAEMQWDRIHASELWGASASLTFTRPTFNHAAGLMTALPPIPLVKHQDACLSFRPMYTLSETDKRRAADPESPLEMIEVQPFTVKIEQHRPDTVSWYAQLAGTIMDVDCQVTDERIATLQENHERDHHGRIIRHQWEPQPTGAVDIDERVKWWSSAGTPSPYTFWWNFEPGATFANYLRKPE